MGNIQQYNELSNQTLNEMIAAHMNAEDKHWSTDINAALELAQTNFLAIAPSLNFMTWESFALSKVDFKCIGFMADSEKSLWMTEAVKPTRAIALAYLMKHGLLEKEDRNAKNTLNLPMVDASNEYENLSSGSVKTAYAPD